MIGREIKMSEHDKEVIIKFANWLYERNLLYSIDVDYDWDENPYEIVTSIIDPMMVVEEYMESRIINNEDGGDIF